MSFESNLLVPRSVPLNISLVTAPVPIIGFSNYSKIKDFDLWNGFQSLNFKYAVRKYFVNRGYYSKIFVSIGTIFEYCLFELSGYHFTIQCSFELGTLKYVVRKTTNYSLIPSPAPSIGLSMGSQIKDSGCWNFLQISNFQYTFR